MKEVTVSCDKCNKVVDPKPDNDKDYTDIIVSVVGFTYKGDQIQTFDYCVSCWDELKKELENRE